MAYENDVLTRNNDDELSVRVVQSVGDNPASSYDDIYTRDANGKLAVRVVGAGGGGGGAVSSVNGKTGDVVLDAEDVGALPSDTPIPSTAKDVNAVPQLSEMPTADASNVGDIVQFGGNQPTIPASATVSQTSGSGLTDLAVDIETFETQETESGNYAFVASVGADSVSPTVFENIGADSATFTFDSSTFLAAVKNAMPSVDFSQVNLLQVETYDGTEWWVYAYDENDSMLGSISTYLAQLESDYGLTISGTFTFDSSVTLNMYYTAGQVTWEKDSETVDIADYGITFSGTPVDGDVLTVTYVATVIGYENGYFYQNQPKYGDPSATISQTTGSGLTDLTVDAVKFSEQESETGEYDFVKDITPSSYNLESGQPGFSVVMDAETVKGRLVSRGNDTSQFYLGYSGGSYQIGYDANTLYYSGITASGLYNNFSITVPENPDASADGTWGVFVYVDSSDSWKLNNNDVNISDYGITYTGTPVNNDVLTVDYTAPAVIGYQWNQKDVQPAGNGGGQEIEYTDIMYDPQTDIDLPLVWVAEFENLPTGDYYFYVKTAKYTSTESGDQPIWQTNKIRFHWDSTWSGSSNVNDFRKTITIAPVLDGDFVGDVTQSTLFNVGGSPVSVHYNSSGNKYAISVYNSALVETVSGNTYYGVGGVIYKVSKLYGGVEPLDITLGKKYEYEYSVSGYQYYTYGGNTYSILPQPEPLKSKCMNQQYTVSNFTSTYRVFEIQSTMYPTDSRISSIRLTAKCSGGELDAYVYYRHNMEMYQIIKKATGVFANSRIYKRENYTNIYVSLDYSAFALLPDQSEPVYVFCAIFGTGSETEPNVTLNSVDVSTTGFTMLDFDKSGVRLAMDLPTAETYGGVVQYVGETDANYTKGYFYEADGTLVNVPMGGTITDIDPSGASVTIDYEELVAALMNAMGWDRSYTVGLLKQYSGYTDTWDVSDNTLTLDGIALIGLDSYPNVATFADYGGASQVTFKINDFQDAHQELQNPHWTRVDVQPSGAPTATTATLAVNDWSSNTQTVNVTGVTANNLVQVAPAPSSNSDYVSGGVLCTAQGAGTLTFTCTATPTNAITVNVVIFG